MLAQQQLVAAFKRDIEVVIGSDFTPKTLEPLMQVVWDELSKL